METRSHAGTLEKLHADGQLLTKLGALPVVVFADGDDVFAIEDRCPHMGFPLHRGTVECGMVTCHWHHARFDLVSGGTLDPWADDTKAFDVIIEDADVYVQLRHDDEIARLHQRLREGLEDNLTLVIAKSVLGLLEAGAEPTAVLRTAVDFGTTYRRGGWGAGLTVLVAMANVLPALHSDDRATALIHALGFVARDTAGHAPRFAVSPLPTHEIASDRISQWYRRFIETRSSDSAERALRTAIESGAPLEDIERIMVAAITDHIFIDEGHTLDFTNKAFEALTALGRESAGVTLTSLVSQTAAAARSEEESEWQYPDDLVALVAQANSALLAERSPATTPFTDVSGLAWQYLADDPRTAVDALIEAWRSGATEAQLGQALAFAAALRITRFHTQNDHADWNTVHHSFTSANALHHSLQRAPGPESRRALSQAVLRVYLDRFLNVPPARLPSADSGTLEALTQCFDAQGEVDRAGNEAYGFLAGGGSRDALIATLGRALLHEDAQFHWYQVFEAAVRQANGWPEGSEESSLILAGFARFLAAHTPTRRELPNVIRIAARLRRGEKLFEEE